MIVLDVRLIGPLLIRGVVLLSAGSGIMNAIKTPLGAVLMLVIVMILAGLTIASAVSGELTAAAVSAAGLVVIVLIIAMVNAVGKT